MLIVGSKAYSKNSNIPVKYRDIDIIGTSEYAEKLIKTLNPKNVKRTEYLVSLIGINKTEQFDTNNVEILLCDNSTSLKMYREYCKDNSEELIIAPNEVLFSLKKSHIHYPIKFKKHIEVYNKLYTELSGIDKLSHITKINDKETELRLGKLVTPKLNKSAKQFFGQSNGYVTDYFIHDDIHRMVAHLDKPMYEYMQKDSESAMCSKEMWDDFTPINKLHCILEECYVIALERKILPMLFGGKKYISSKEAFEWALMRVCTNLCGGWFREHATNNYLQINDMYNKDYVEDFLGKYDKGLIKKIR